MNLFRGSQENGVKSLVNDHSANWWLIDSGASVTVIAKRFLDSFSLVSRRPLCPSERYSAANDTPVTVFERVKVRVKMLLYEGSSYLGMVPVMVTGADVSHNVRAVSVAGEIEIVLDSGADCSVLPRSFAEVGHDAGGNGGEFEDAQGNPLAVAGVRVAES